MKKDRIFISYSREDLTLARKVEQALIKRGCSVWRDQESVYGGQNFPKAIGEAIANHDILVLIWSKHAHKAHFVEHEWTTALALKKPILPCLFDDTPLPPALSPINGIIFKTLDDTVDKILKAAGSEPDSLTNQDKEPVIAFTQRRKWVTTAILVPIIIGVALIIVQKVNERPHSGLSIRSDLDSASVAEDEFDQSQQTTKKDLPMSITDEANSKTVKQKVKEKSLEETDSTEIYLASKEEMPQQFSKDSANGEKFTSLSKQNTLINDKMLESNDPAMAITLSNLATLYEAQGKYKDAEKIWLRVINIQEKAFSSNHPKYAESAQSLALLYMRLGTPKKAERLQLEALAVFEKVFGLEHPIVATALNNLASIYLVLAMYEKAAPLVERALSIRQKMLGQGDANLIPILQNLLRIYEKSGNIEKTNSIGEQIKKLKEQFKDYYFNKTDMSTHRYKAPSRGRVEAWIYDGSRNKTSIEAFLNGLLVDSATLSGAQEANYARVSFDVKPGDEWWVEIDVSVSRHYPPTNSDHRRITFEAR